MLDDHNSPKTAEALLSCLRQLVLVKGSINAATVVDLLEERGIVVTEVEDSLSYQLRE